MLWVPNKVILFQSDPTECFARQLHFILGLNFILFGLKLIILQFHTKNEGKMRFETKDKIEPQHVHVKANKNYENCNFCAFMCVSSHAKVYVLNYIFPRLEDMRMKHLKPSFQR